MTTTKKSDDDDCDEPYDNCNDWYCGDCSEE
jgi:hypothetical protein